MRQVKEKDVMHENGNYWVLNTGNSYAVMVNKVTHSVSNSHYSHDSDGLSIAIAYCDYLAKKDGEK